jgi:hypothetical protein
MRLSINNFGRSTFAKLAAAALGICVLAPVSQARDHDHDHDQDVDFGIRTDNHGNFGIDLNIFNRDHDRRPAPVERVWVEPVWKCQTERVWVEPVYEKVSERVWCPPVAKDVVERVWVPPVYEEREIVRFQWGRRVVVRERVKVADGHYEERHAIVVVSEGRWDNVDKWVLKCDGHWETKDRWVCISDGHWDERVVREVPVRRDYDRGDRYRR